MVLYMYAYCGCICPMFFDYVFERFQNAKSKISSNTFLRVCPVFMLTWLLRYLKIWLRYKKSSIG